VKYKTGFKIENVGEVIGMILRGGTVYFLAYKGTGNHYLAGLAAYYSFWWSE